MYTQGQAVIYPLGTIFFKTEDGWCLFSGEDVGLLDGGRNAKLATQAEILAEAEKNGWEKYGLNLEAKYVVLIPYSSSWEWEYSNSVLPSEAGLFGQECTTAHRLITALNQTK